MINKILSCPNPLRCARCPVLPLGPMFLAQWLPACPVWHIEVFWRTIFASIAVGPEILGSSMLICCCCSDSIVCELTFNPFWFLWAVIFILSYFTQTGELQSVRLTWSWPVPLHAILSSLCSWLNRYIIYHIACQMLNTFLLNQQFLYTKSGTQ